MFRYDLSLPEIYGYANLWPLKVSNGKGGERYATTDELFFYTAKYNAMCDEYIAKASKIYGPNSSISQQKGYTINLSTEPEPAPLVVEFKDRKGTSNVDFKRRSQSGEIIMSNYSRASVKITQKPERLLINGSKRTVALDFRSTGIGRDLGPNGMSFFPGTRCTALAIGSAAFGHYRITGDAIWNFPPHIDPETLLSSVLAQKPSATDLVTSTLADANARALDILTSMAEMPETIKSVLSGFKSIAKMVKDFKKGEIALSKAFEKRKLYLDRKRQSDLARISNARKGASKYKLILLERHKKRVEYTYSRAVKDSKEELASSLADLWLNFRYNIMPNVYLVEDIEKAFGQWGREWTTTRKREVRQSLLPLFGKEFSVDWISRCLIKRLFYPNSIGNSAVLSANAFVTAWELVPLSFVVDWFINIGDLLSSVTTPQGWKQQGCSLSYLCEFNHTVDFTDDPNHSGVITIEIKAYDRLNINPLDYVGLVWQPDLSPVRQLDALALIWRPVRLLLSKIK